jgi:replicative DNA helicase
MGEVREGDFLLSDAGEPTKVVGASDIKLNAKCYQIEFDDGTTIVADANHQWKVARRHWKGVDRLRRTEQLEAGKFYVRTAYPLQLPDMELPIDPYVLGAWLGDGTSAGASITAGDQDVEEMVANIEACGQPTQVHWYHHCWRIGLNDGNNGSKGNPFMRSLRQLGVLNNKHIPDTYLRASFDQRLALLQGLMDTDGAAGGNGGPQCEFVTTSEPLAAGFAELVRSLGFKAKSLTLDESATHPTMRCCKLRRQFWFTAYPEMPVFRLKRKLDQSNQRERTHRFRPCHRIKSIREVDSVPVRCVVVDGPTSMFLAGAGMIPTHNSTWRTKQEIMYGMRGAYTTRELAIRSKPLLEEMRIVEQNGDQIAAPNNENDDRVIATALAIRAWTNWRRGPLLSRGLTYERVRAEEAGTSTLHSRSLNGLVARFMLTKEQEAELRDDRPEWMVSRGLA